MGWLLIQRKGGKASRKPRGSSIDPRPWNPASTLANFEALAAVAVLAAIVVGWRFAESALSRYVHQRELPRIGAHQVDLSDAPRWMSPRLRKELQAEAAKVASGDPLDADALERVVERLGQNPWVERVKRVQRMPQGRLRVLADYREPAATVQTPEGFRLVDIAGVHLPGLYREEQVPELALPRIVGVAKEPGPLGQVWPGEDIRAGLALVRLLRREPYMTQIVTFDVGQRYARDRIRLALHTRRGQVVWGSPPGQELAMEPDAAQKKRRLDEIRNDRRSAGAIDAGGRVVLIDGPMILAQDPAVEDQTLSVGYTWSR